MGIIRSVLCTCSSPDAAFDIVTVAASAGGIQALNRLLQNLPAEFPAPIVVVMHLPPASRHVSRLVDVLQRHTFLRVKWAEDGEYPVPGTVYVAPQDRRSIIHPETGCLVVSSGNSQLKKPAADPLFCSAALAFGTRAMAVVLSGVLCDGAFGSAMVARAGGRVLAQSPSEAQFADMPQAAMTRSHVGLAFDSASLAHVIANLVMIPGVAKWFGIGKAGVCAQLLGEQRQQVRPTHYASGTKSGTGTAGRGKARHLHR